MWGQYGERAPTTKERGQFIRTLLEGSLNQLTRNFDFKVRNHSITDPKDKRNFTRVCEGSLLKLSQVTLNVLY